MIEWLSSVGSWLSRNGSASDWLTSFGTVGAVIISLYLSYSKKQIKIKLQTTIMKKEAFVSIHNFGKEVVYITDVYLRFRFPEEKLDDFEPERKILLDHAVYPNQTKKIEINKQLNAILLFSEKHSQEKLKEDYMLVQVYVIANQKKFKAKEVRVPIKKR